MTRKPSFDFERRERAKGKTLKRTEKAKAKADKKSPVADADASERHTGESTTDNIRS